MSAVTDIPSPCLNTTYNTTTMKRLLRECSPHYHPYRWLGVNCVILFWSAILLVEILATIGSHNDDEKTGIEWNYLLYNFGACAVWLIEVFFNVLDWRGYFDSREGVGEESLLQPIQKVERSKRGVIALWIELGFAAYFSIDSTLIVVHLSRKQIHRQAEGMTFDVCLNMVAYAFMVYWQFVDWRESGQNSGQASEHLPTTEVHSTRRGWCNLL